MYWADKNKLFPTDMGLIVTDFLANIFLQYLTTLFTASVEKDFDEIVAGKRKWTEMLKDFMILFMPLLKNWWCW